MCLEGCGSYYHGEPSTRRHVNWALSSAGGIHFPLTKTEREFWYDAGADFDRNATINASDFGLLAVNYMKMCPVDVSG